MFHSHLGKVNISPEQRLVLNCVPTGEILKQPSASGALVLHHQTIEINSGPLSLVQLDPFCITSATSDHSIKCCGGKILVDLHYMSSGFSFEHDRILTGTICVLLSLY